MPRAIGIDLGTTCSCVGVFRNGRVEIIANDQGNRTTPSYVAFTDTDRLVGDAVMNVDQSQEANSTSSSTCLDNNKRPKRTRSTCVGELQVCPLSKRLLGRRYNDPTLQADVKFWPFKVVETDGRPNVCVELKGETKAFTPEELSSMVLTKMKETAEAYLGETVRDAVVTVPAYFNDAQRQATKDAGTIAGLNVLQIINEPTAAALAYGLNSESLKGEKNVLIFDLGGGTFDVSILTIDEGSLFEVKSTAGDTRLGGEDFDNRLMRHFIQEFKMKYKKDLDKSPSALRCLRSACERAKRTLSNSTEAFVKIEALYEGIDFHSNITRPKFEELCSDLFRSLLQPVETVLRYAKLDKSNIHDVVLVGGSTRIPAIQKLLADFFDGKALYKSINPDEAVAYGAAVQAAKLIGDKSDAIGDILSMDIIPRSIGTDTGATAGIMMSFVRRGTTIPTEAKMILTTNVDNQQRIDFNVYEGERTVAKDNNLLGRFVLSGISPAQRGVLQVEVTFDIDANGILNVTAKEMSTGRVNNIMIKSDRGCLGRDAIDRILSMPRKYMEEDDLQRQRLAAKNGLESYIFSVKQAVEKAEEIVSSDEKEKMNDACDESLAWLSSNSSAEKEEFERHLQDLQRIASPVVTKLQS